MPRQLKPLTDQEFEQLKTDLCQTVEGRYFYSFIQLVDNPELLAYLGLVAEFIVENPGAVDLNLVAKIRTFTLLEWRVLEALLTDQKPDLSVTDYGYGSVF
jgi:hypothetical protein